MLEYLAKSCVSYYQTNETRIKHYDDVIMDTIASQITSLTIVYSIVYSGTDHRKHQSSASLASVRGIHRGPVNFPHKGPVTRKIFPLDDVIMTYDRVMAIVLNHTDMIDTITKSWMFTITCENIWKYVKEAILNWCRTGEAKLYSETCL